MLEPRMATRHHLEIFHTRRYLDVLQSSPAIAVHLNPDATDGTFDSRSVPKLCYRECKVVEKKKKKI